MTDMRMCLNVCNCAFGCVLLQADSAAEGQPGRGVPRGRGPRPRVPVRPGASYCPWEAAVVLLCDGRRGPVCAHVDGTHVK